MKALLLVPLLLPLCSTCIHTAVFTVTSTADSGPGTFRAALALANETTGHDTIAFELLGGSVHVISVLGGLPSLTDPAGVLVDGFTQSGASPGVAPPRSLDLKVVLDGAAAGASCGLVVASSNNTIRGLSVINFQRDGIRLQATADGTRNNLVYANAIGTDPRGAPGPNAVDTASIWAGVSITSASMLPVLTSAFENAVSANVIAANLGVGVAVRSAPPTQVYLNTVESNWIGCSFDAVTPLGNRLAGVLIENGASSNSIASNVIGGNGGDGVAIVGHVEQPVLQWWSRDNVVSDNRIGFTPDGCPLPNAGNGVSIGLLSGQWRQGFASHNAVRLNSIAYNGGGGIVIWEHPFTTNNTDSNTISWNSIHHNLALGIDLGDDGVTRNDDGDVDRGANGELNTPELDSALSAGGVVSIFGFAGSVLDPTTLNVEVFLASGEGDPSGEGIAFLATVVPDVHGGWTVRVPGLNPGDQITATVTDGAGNTSEFSRNIVVRDVVVAVEATDPPRLLDLW